MPQLCLPGRTLGTAVGPISTVDVPCIEDKGGTASASGLNARPHHGGARTLPCPLSRPRPPAPDVRSTVLPPALEEMEEWKVVGGKFLAVNAMNMCCACPRCPGGLSPAAHLGDGSLDLILIRKCSRFNFLRFLIRHTNQHDQVRAPPPQRCWGRFSASHPF